MAQIKSEIEYNAIKERVEELLLITDDTTPLTDKNMIELDKLFDLLEEYDMEHFPISEPSFTDTLKLRMYEMGLTQKSMSELIGVSPSRLSNYMTGKSEPTLKVAREISKKLNISADIILGV